MTDADAKTAFDAAWPAMLEAGLQALWSSGRVDGRSEADTSLVIEIWDAMIDTQLPGMKVANGAASSRRRDGDGRWRVHLAVRLLELVVQQFRFHGGRGADLPRLSDPGGDGPAQRERSCGDDDRRRHDPEVDPAQGAGWA